MPCKIVYYLTGIHTGTVYSAKNVNMKGIFKGEGVRTGKVIAIKTHEKNYVIFDRAIVLIRNPYDAILADFNRRAAGKVGYANNQLFETAGEKLMVYILTKKDTIDVYNNHHILQLYVVSA